MVRSWHPSPEVIARILDAQATQATQADSAASTVSGSGSSSSSDALRANSVTTTNRNANDALPRMESPRASSYRGAYGQQSNMNPVNTGLHHTLPYIRVNRSRPQRPFPASEPTTARSQSQHTSQGQIASRTTTNSNDSMSNSQRRAVRSLTSPTPDDTTYASIFDSPTLRRGVDSSSVATTPTLTSSSSNGNIRNSDITSRRTTSSQYSTQHAGSRPSVSGRSFSLQSFRTPRNSIINQQALNSSSSSNLPSSQPRTSTNTQNSRNIQSNSSTSIPQISSLRLPSTRGSPRPAASLYRSPTQTTSRNPGPATPASISSRFRGVYLQTPTRKSSTPRSAKECKKSKISPSSTSTWRLAKEESDAFHHSAVARCSRCMFDTLPIEILCSILEYVILPRTEEMSVNDDGDGPKAGSSLRYWYLDPNRSLLRLVCRNWNLTILAMAREIFIELGSDESMASLLDSVAAERRAAATARLRASSSQRLPTNDTPFDLSLYSSGVHSPASTGRALRTLRRSARLLEALGSSPSTSSPSSVTSSPSTGRSSLSTPTRPRVRQSFPLTSELPRSSRVSFNFSRYAEFAESHGIQFDRHPRLFQHVAQSQSDNQRVAKQTFIPIEKFYDSLQGASDMTMNSSARSSSGSKTPWTCPPHISSLSVKGKLPRYLDPQEDAVLSAIHSGMQSHVGNDEATNPSASSSVLKRLTSEKGFGTKLENWLRAAVPKSIKSFSVSSSSDFGMNGLLLLPRSLTELNISRCPKLMGGTLFIGFRHLSNLTCLTMCSELLFTDESFISALETLIHLRQFDYTYPCDPIQPAWRDLFRYCSSCELYHRRLTAKTYTRKLVMPVLPSQIQWFTFAMDEPRFQHQRIDTYDHSNDGNQHSLDRSDSTQYWLCLWRSEDSSEAQNDIQNNDNDIKEDQHHDGAESMMRGVPHRPWWPENLTRLDLSQCVVMDSRFDVPPQLKELVIAYPLEPKEIQVEGSDSKLEEDKQWFPESLMSFEVRGVPYHASCEVQDNPSVKVASWMSYTNTMLKRVPRHLEHFIINSFQVPDIDAMTALQARTGKTLKTWIVRLLCPQRPKQSGHNALQLYAPIIYVDDDATDDEQEHGWRSMFQQTEPDSDEYDDVLGSLSLRRILRQQLYSAGSMNYSSRNNSSNNSNTPGQEEMRHIAESEQYDITPVMLRNATKRMEVLEKLEVHVNFQHYRFCQSIWKGRLGLSEPIATTMKENSEGLQDSSTFATSEFKKKPLPSPESSFSSSSSSSSSTTILQPDSFSSLSALLSHRKTSTHPRDSASTENHDNILNSFATYRHKKRKLTAYRQTFKDFMTPTLTPLDTVDAGKGVHRRWEYPQDRPTSSLPMSFSTGSESSMPLDVKGKGKKVESCSPIDLTKDTDVEEVEDEDKSADSSRPRPVIDNVCGVSNILGHGRRAGCPATEIVYWNNSCCGKRCLGWMRHSLN
ncbi:hypothetical protein BGZ46_003941 [Entomortierella lignicola]|nr:hypothetical protein BGZ46_003941 [Entomortierella lignicola]